MTQNILSVDEEKLLLKIFRENCLCFLENKEYILPKIFHEKLGVFVTLTKNGLLRGCIGYLYPIIK